MTGVLLFFCKINAKAVMWIHTGKRLLSLWNWPSDKWDIYCHLPGHWFQPWPLSLRRTWVFFVFLALVQNEQPVHLCEWSLFPVLWNFSSHRYRALWPGYSWPFKTHCLIMRLYCRWPPARPASVICEDQAKSPIVFPLEGDFLKFHLVYIFFLFSFEIILDLQKKFQK